MQASTGAQGPDLDTCQAPTRPPRHQRLQTTSHRGPPSPEQPATPPPSVFPVLEPRRCVCAASTWSRQRDWSALGAASCADTSPTFLPPRLPHSPPPPPYLAPHSTPLHLPPLTSRLTPLHSTPHPLTPPQLPPTSSTNPHPYRPAHHHHPHPDVPRGRACKTGISECLCLQRPVRCKCSSRCQSPTRRLRAECAGMSSLPAAMRRQEQRQPWGAEALE